MVAVGVRTFSESLGVGVVALESRDDPVHRHEGRGCQHPGLTPASAQHLPQS